MLLVGQIGHLRSCPGLLSPGTCPMTLLPRQLTLPSGFRFLTSLPQKAFICLSSFSSCSSSSPLPFHTNFCSVQLLSHVRLFATLGIAAHQASLSITNSRNLLKLMPSESVMPSSHLILCCPLLLLPPIPPSIRVFSNESTLLLRWPKYWSFSFSIFLDHKKE